MSKPETRIALQTLLQIGDLTPNSPKWSELQICLKGNQDFINKLSDTSYNERVRLLLEPWNLGHFEIHRLERVWREEFQSPSTTVSANRLRSLARDIGSNRYDAPSEIEEWRMRLSLFLSEVGIQAQKKNPGERIDAHILDLTTVGYDWPKKILTDKKYKYVQSLLPDHSLPLDSTWVELQLVNLFSSFDGEALFKEDEALNAGKFFKDDRSLTEHGRSFGLKAALDNISGLTFFIGDPGCGKTTLVNWIAREVIRGNLGSFLLPLVVRLKDHPGIGKTSLLRLALRACGLQTDELILSWELAIERIIKADPRSVILLVDGIDELPGKGPALARLQEEVADDLESLGKKMTVIATSRPSGISTEFSLHSQSALRISDISEATSKLLIKQWCEKAGLVDSEISELQQHIVQHPDLQRMAMNPFLVTCICAVGVKSLRASKELPTRRLEIYEGCIDLAKRVRYPNQSRALMDDDVSKLSRLAHFLLSTATNAPRYTFDLQDVEVACDESTFFLETIKPGRLVSKWDHSQETLYFTHTTFQEYLASTFLASGGASNVGINGALSSFLFDPTWREVFAFVGAQNPSKDSLFWSSVAEASQEIDHFGVALISIGYWLAELGMGTERYDLTGNIDIFDELLSHARNSASPVTFLSTCAVLAPTRFCEIASAELNSPDLEWRRALLRVLLSIPLPEFSGVVTDQILQNNIRRTWTPPPYRLSLSGLTKLRNYLEAGVADESTTKQIIEMLGMTKDSGALNLLQKLIKESGPFRKKAIESVALIGGPDAFHILKEQMEAPEGTDQWEESVWGMGQMLEVRARDFLLRNLARVDPTDHPRVLPILRALQDHNLGSASRFIIDLLDSENVEVRDFAACTLHRARPSPEVSMALATAAQHDSSESVRSAALLSFEFHARHEDLCWLEVVVRDEERNPEEREAALMAIGDLLVRYPNLQDRYDDILDYAFDTEPLLRTATNIASRMAGKSVDRLLNLLDRFLTGSLENKRKDLFLEMQELCRVLGELKCFPALKALGQIVRNKKEDESIRQSAASAIAAINPSLLIELDCPVSKKALGLHCIESGKHLKHGRLTNLGRSVAQITADNSLPENELLVVEALRRGPATNPDLAQYIYGDRTKAEAVRSTIKRLRKKNFEIVNRRDGTGNHLLSEP